MQPSFAELSTRSVDAGHLLGRVHSLESMGSVDGPGTRFVIFLQGCQLRCLYCHNRDTWEVEGGRFYSVADLITEILPYIPFIDASGGGVTVSGGEPLLQREFMRVLFKMLNFQGIHTCLDTNGYLPANQYDDELEGLVRCVDLILLDLKQIDNPRHHALTGVDNENPLRFARYLSERHKRVWIRHVVVPGYSDRPDDLRRLGEFIASLQGVERVELIPYHTLGAHKWSAYAKDYPLAGVEPPGRGQMEDIKGLFSEYGLMVV